MNAAIRQRAVELLAALGQAMTDDAKVALIEKALTGECERCAVLADKVAVEVGQDSTIGRQDRRNVAAALLTLADGYRGNPTPMRALVRRSEELAQ